MTTTITAEAIVKKRCCEEVKKLEPPKKLVSCTHRHKQKYIYVIHAHEY
jgi:hypothetical protein